jgi:replicative DNA helicase
MKINNLDHLADANEMVNSISEIPNNSDAEKALLGAFLNNNDNINQVNDFLKPDHFYVPLHSKIYEAILELNERGLIASPVTLKNYFENELKESKVSSIDYLMKLSIQAASIINLAHYAKEVFDTFLRRSLIKVCEDSIRNVHDYDNYILTKQLIEEAEQRLFTLALDGSGQSEMRSMKSFVCSTLEKMESARKNGGKISGVCTGFSDVDKILGGMQDSDLLILAARPSMGKTALAVNIAVNAAESFSKLEIKKSVAVFSLEMSGEQITNRLFAMKTGINGISLRNGSYNDNEAVTVANAGDQIGELPIFINDISAITISALRTHVRRLKRHHNLGLLVIDYLQLIKGTSKPNQFNRVLEVGEISIGLKAIAKDLNIPILALSQLSRALESREDKRPQLSDLRESGNIEQDADVVMFIYRDEYYLSRKEPQIHEVDKYSKWLLDMEKAKGVTEILIAKQRNGAIGNVSIKYNPTTTRFEDL